MSHFKPLLHGILTLVSLLWAVAVVAICVGSLIVYGPYATLARSRRFVAAH